MATRRLVAASFRLRLSSAPFPLAVPLLLAVLILLLISFLPILLAVPLPLILPLLLSGIPAGHTRPVLPIPSILLISIQPLSRAIPAHGVGLVVMEGVPNGVCVCDLGAVRRIPLATAHRAGYGQAEMPTLDAHPATSEPGHPVLYEKPSGRKTTEPNAGLCVN